MLIQPGYLLDRWRYFTKDIISPDSYIDMGFYYMITAALQRKVWLGSDIMPLFPNVYVILVGNAGTGKGLLLKQVSQILKYHKVVKEDRPDKIDPFETRKEEINKAKEVLKVNGFDDIFKQNRIIQAQQQVRTGSAAEGMLIPVAPDATTYEKLVNIMAKTVRKVDYWGVNEKGEKVKRAYIHKSICFCLEEISSLLSKNTDKIVNFLLVTFDCGDYDYETKHQGTDKLRRTCLNLLGGTTPSFMQQTFDSRLVNDGFTARTIFVYASGPRFNRFGPVEFNDDQLKARQEVIDYIAVLAKLYGHIKFSKTETPEAWDIMQNYFEHELPITRVNINPKLEGYYQRKNIHALKIAMAVHFSYSTDLVLTPYDCITALDILAKLERPMHNALNFGKNLVAPIMKSVLKFLVEVGKPLSFADIWKEHVADATEIQMQEALRALVVTEKIKYDAEKGLYSPAISNLNAQLLLIKEALEKDIKKANR